MDESISSVVVWYWQNFSKLKQLKCITLVMLASLWSQKFSRPIQTSGARTEEHVLQVLLVRDGLHGSSSRVDPRLSWLGAEPGNILKLIKIHTVHLKKFIVKGKA